MKPTDQIHRSGASLRAQGFSDRPPLLLRHLGKGARVRLVCGACAWSRTYDPHRLITRLTQKGLPGPATAIAHVARHVQWPCPACRRMAWATEPVFGSDAAPTSPVAAATAGGGR